MAKQNKTIVGATQFRGQMYLPGQEKDLEAAAKKAKATLDWDRIGGGAPPAPEPAPEPEPGEDDVEGQGEEPEPGDDEEPEEESGGKK